MQSLLRASARRPPLLLALAAVLGLALVACAQSLPATPAATNQVDLPRSYRFAPADIVVSVGTTVTWTNNDNFTHNVRFIHGGDEALVMKPGEQVTHVFQAAGLFQYECSLHPKDMKGTVQVRAGNG